MTKPKTSFLENKKKNNILSGTIRMKRERKGREETHKRTLGTREEL